MTFAIYDNPATARREQYRSGELVADVTLNLLYDYGAKERHRLPVALNVGRWVPGRCVAIATRCLKSSSGIYAPSKSSRRDFNSGVSFDRRG